MVTPHHMAFTFLVSYVLPQNALTTLKQLWKNRRSNHFFLFIEWWRPIIWRLHFSYHTFYHKTPQLLSNNFEKIGGAIKKNNYWMVTPQYMVFTFLVSYGLPQSDPPTIKYLWENRRGNHFVFLLAGDAPSYGAYISLLVFMHTYVIVFLILITVIL